MWGGDACSAAYPDSVPGGTGERDFEGTGFCYLLGLVTTGGPERVREFRS